MDCVREDARQIRIPHECDICVVGGSCTGVLAAVAAARLGGRAALVEMNGFLGGATTAALVLTWTSTRDGQNKETIIAGLTREVIERLKRRDGVVVVEPDAPETHEYIVNAEEQRFVLNPEELKIELDELLVEAGVRSFLHARFVAPVMEDGRLTAVIIEDKSGRRAIRAGFFVDATGDGDLVHRMGLACNEPVLLQPPTTCAILAGLDEIRRRDPGFSLNREVFNQAHPEALKAGALWWCRTPGAKHNTLVAGTRVPGADCADADQLTRAEIEGRRQVRAICDILREHAPGGDRVALVNVAAHIGVRETRHARCLHTLTETEVLSGQRFPDAIANSSFRIDIHSGDRPGVIFRYLDGREVCFRPDGAREQGRWRRDTGESPPFYQIPYRCLVPTGAINVLVAGRLIGADAGAYGSIRVIVNGNQTGQAAGAAAYLALDGNLPVASVDPARLRETLSRQGAIVL